MQHLSSVSMRHIPFWWKFQVMKVFPSQPDVRTLVRMFRQRLLVRVEGERENGQGSPQQELLSLHSLLTNSSLKPFGQKCCLQVTALQNKFYSSIRKKKKRLGDHGTTLKQWKIFQYSLWNDSWLNNHQRLQLQGWRANCDIQGTIGYHVCVEYLAKYAEKTESRSHILEHVFSAVVHNSLRSARLFISRDCAPLVISEFYQLITQGNRHQFWMDQEEFT